jgi:hypothetical protein
VSTAPAILGFVRWLRIRRTRSRNARDLRELEQLQRLRQAERERLRQPQLTLDLQLLPDRVGLSLALRL